MSIGQRLFKTDSLSASVGVYVPAVGFQRLLGFVRAIVFMWLLGAAQFGLWAMGCMVFELGSTLVTLAAFNGILRYVSQYQARGALRLLFGALGWRLVLLAAALTGALVLAGPWLAGAAIGTVSSASGVDASRRLNVFELALVNALLMALYLNQTSWLRGLRAYRLLSVVDVFYGVVFLAVAVPVASRFRSAEAVLIAHAASLAISLVLGLWGLRSAMAAEPPADGAREEPASVSDRPGEIFRRVLGFSVVSMVALGLWQVQGAVSLWFAQRYHGERGAGLYRAFFVICQVIPVLATTIWAIVLSHVAMHWERGDKALAREMLEVAYKAVMLALAALSAAILATRDLWQVVLPAEFRDAAGCLQWLLVGVLASAGLGYAYVAWNLREKPRVWVIIATVAVLVNIALAAWLVPVGDAAAGAERAAQATAFSSLACLLAATAYLVIGRFGASPAALAVGFSALLLILPPVASAAAAAALVVLAVATPWVFSVPQRRVLGGLAIRVLGRLRGRRE